MQGAAATRLLAGMPGEDTMPSCARAANDKADSKTVSRPAQVMDKHLQTLSQKHLETRFVRVSKMQPADGRGTALVDRACC